MCVSLIILQSLSTAKMGAAHVWDSTKPLHFTDQSVSRDAPLFPVSLAEIVLHNVFPIGLILGIIVLNIVPKFLQNDTCGESPPNERLERFSLKIRANNYINEIGFLCHSYFSDFSMYVL